MSQIAVAPGQSGPMPQGPKRAAVPQDADRFSEALGKAGRTLQDAAKEPSGETNSAGTKANHPIGPRGDGTGAGHKAPAENQSLAGPLPGNPDAAVKIDGGDDGTVSPNSAERTGEDAPDRRAGAAAETADASERAADGAAAMGSNPAATVMAVMSFLNARNVGGQGAQDARMTQLGAVASAEATAASPGAGHQGDDGLAKAALGGAADEVGAAIKAAFGGRPDGAGEAPFTPGKASPRAVEATRFELPGSAAGPTASAVSPAPSEGGRSTPPVVPLDLGRALAGEGDLPASMREAVSSHVARVMVSPAQGQPMPVLRIQLQPAHLGQVNVTMRMSGEQMQVTLTPDSASAARVLGSDQDAIAGVLRSLGGAFAGASIEVGAEPYGRQNGDGADFRQGGSARDQMTGGDGRGGGAGSGPPWQGNQGDGPPSGTAGELTGSSGQGRIII